MGATSWETWLVSGAARWPQVADWGRQEDEAGTAEKDPCPRRRLKGSPLFRPEGRDGPLQPSCDPQKSPDTPGSPEGNTEGPGTASSEPLLPS